MLTDNTILKKKNKSQVKCNCTIKSNIGFRHFIEQTGMRNILRTFHEYPVHQTAKALHGRIGIIRQIKAPAMMAGASLAAKTYYRISMIF